MGRYAKDSQLGTLESRRQLDGNGPYWWRQIHSGLFVGYRRLAPKAGKPVAGNWYVKYLHPVTKTYKKKKLGNADDYCKADGIQTLDFKQAQLKAIEHLQKSLDIQIYTVSHAIHDYIEHYIIKNSPNVNTLNTTQAVINKHIKIYLGFFQVNDLKHEGLLKWRDSLVKGTDVVDESERYETLRKQRSTANRILNILKAVLNHAFSTRSDIISDTAWRKLKPFPNTDADNVRVLTLNETKRLINACEPDFRMMVRAALYTGCRYNELANMRVGALKVLTDTNNNKTTYRIEITKESAKNSKARFISLNADGVKFFQQLVVGKTGSEFMFNTNEGEPWKKSMQSRRMKTACKKSKIIPEATFHNLRDTYASLLVSAGVPMRAVSDQLGHSHTKITEKFYARFAPTETDALIDRHLPSFGLEETNLVSIEN